MTSIYLPTIDHSLWPCAVLLVVFIPISIARERSWRRTLAAYAEVRRAAGAAEGAWPPPGLANAMGVQPRLLFLVAGMLGAVTLFGAYVAIIWPQKFPGFDLPVNPFDLPFLWSMVVAGTAAVVAVVAIAIDLGGSPWMGVSRELRRVIYASAAERERVFAAALELDPGVPDGSADAGAAVADAPRRDPEAEDPSETADA